MVRDVMVPRVGVEPTRPYGQRILSLKQAVRLGSALSEVIQFS